MGGLAQGIKSQVTEGMWAVAQPRLTSQPLQPLLPPPPPHHQQEHEQQQDPQQDAGDGHQHLEPLVGRQPIFALDH